MAMLPTLVRSRWSSFRWSLIVALGVIALSFAIDALAYDSPASSLIVNTQRSIEPSFGLEQAAPAFRPLVHPAVHPPR